MMTPPSKETPMYATIAGLILGAFLGLVVVTNSLVEKVDGINTIQCATHSCYTVGDNVYMIK
jgi:hypothetical protein